MYSAAILPGFSPYFNTLRRVGLDYTFLTSSAFARRFSQTPM